MNDYENKILKALDQGIIEFTLGVDLSYLQNKTEQKTTTLRKYLKKLIDRGWVSRFRMPGRKAYLYAPNIPSKEDQRCYQCSQGWNLGQAARGIWHCPVKGMEVPNETGSGCEQFIYNRKKDDQKPHVKGDSTNPAVKQ